MGAGHIAGFYHAQFSLRNAAGYPVGIVADPENIANGTESHAHKLIGPVEATPLTIGREAALFKGGQKILGRRQLGINDIGSFDITLTAFDETFHALITGSNIDTALATANSITTPNLNEADPPQGMLLLTLGYQTTAGVNKYVTYGYHNVQISEAEAGGGNQNGGDNPNPLRYTVTVTSATKTFFGIDYADLDVGATDDSDFFVRYVTAKPIGLSYFKADASDTSFLVGYRPVAAEHAGARNVFSKDGATAHASVSGVSTTTGAITISSQSGGEQWVTVYETDFQAI